MPPTSEDYVRAGHRLLGARVLRHRHWRSRGAFAADVGVSVRTIADVEKGRLGRRHGWDPGTIAILEDAVGWTPGSYDQVLGGGEPTMRDEQRTLPEEITVRTRDVMDNPNLTEEMREEMLAVLADAAEAYDSGKQPAKRRNGVAS